MNNEPKHPWTLMVDEASNVKGSVIGVYLKLSNNEVIKQSFRLGFKVYNNEAEYEALIARLRSTKVIRARRLKVQSDSQLIVNQVLVVVQSLKPHSTNAPSSRFRET